MDVVVVGFGAAGACAAIEAAASGASVLVIDRFGGGGATAISGGVVYAGGGTRQQRSANILDTPLSMYGYLHREVRGAVSDETLRRFCDESAANLAWLEEQGVPFEASLCPYKTSYPSDDHYLYWSGNEHLYPDPAPRGHRTYAPGTSGGLLYSRLADAARTACVRFRPQTRAVGLIADDAGRVTGVRVRALRSGVARRAHGLLHRWSVKSGVYLPRLGRRLHRVVRWIEDRWSAEEVIAADAVVLTAGGFVFDREMMREHAPLYRGLRLGTPGDDGAGIRLGTALGAGVRHLDRVTMWRFVTPPSALAGGILIDRDGRRVGDASAYGAALGDAILDRPGGRAWLLVDSTILSAARGQVREQSLWFQRLQAWWLMSALRTTAPTVEEAARRVGITGSFTYPSNWTGPFSLLDVSLRVLPAPMLTLGGLTVDESSGAVLRADGSVIGGLYAAGRTAVGVCSGSYVSGLSLADCVFSGRRAGRSSTCSVPPS
ncbi:FAD-binding protein [Actinoplanes couchii]|uniref:Pyridine nucleotide-disulfide oxidoreductase n=1 Tax=Actinoplanes couchii TaxID=403638 RepID=A0ABQ3XF43_9ACTN|nr:FAD-binding protein [Actinoplanes couchii]MDR6321913.1 3-oxo-5alpha-steroid 4-dehydrogenase [Actinoplanes couchii]GID57132.1 pyridine nucleotide-disulfide oxidoreductase [Actinoplanes couchii]